jgi:hypothetical protein
MVIPLSRIRFRPSTFASGLRVTSIHDLRDPLGEWVHRTSEEDESDHNAPTLLTWKKNVKGSFRRDRRAFSQIECGEPRPDRRFTETPSAVDGGTRSFRSRAPEAASNRANSATVDNCGKVDNL